MTRASSLIVAVTTLLAAPALAGPFDLKNLVGKVVDTVKQVQTDNSPQEEQNVGRQAAATLLGAAPLMTEGNTLRYVNRVGAWVAAHSDRPELPWRFAVLDTGTINAFAAPGGYVLVTRGLLMKLRNEGELAGVLAHEIAHVQLKHHMKQIKQQHLLGAAAGSAKTDYSVKAGGQELINFDARSLYANALSKDDEYAADRVGVVLAARAGYDPYGLLTVLQTLDGLKPDDLAMALLFKTHPRPADRLAKLDPFLAERSDLDALAGRPDGQARFLAAMQPSGGE